MRADLSTIDPAPALAGPSAWTRDTLGPAAWTVPVPAAALAELDDLVGRLRRARRPVDDVVADGPRLAACAALMDEARGRLERGPGLAVLDRFPVERYAVDENRAIGWVLAGMLGRVVAQKMDGTRIYDVKDTGVALAHGVRRSLTNLGQPFHTDGGFLSRPPTYIGLFCLETALEGGISRFVSLVTVHNLLRQRHPALLPRLYRPFRWDRQAEHAAGTPPHARRPVFEHAGDGLVARWYEDYIVKGQALAGEPLDAEGAAALAAMRALVDLPGHWVEFQIARGQFQYLNNLRFAHCRTAFADGDLARRRHMLRFWNRDEGRPDLEADPAA